MTTYVLRNGKLIEKHLAEPHPRAGVYVMSDGMDLIRHPVTGEFTDSKSRFRNMTRATGCVEVGTETMRPRTDFVKRGESAQQTIKRIYNL